MWRWGIGVLGHVRYECTRRRFDVLYNGVRDFFHHNKMSFYFHLVRCRVLLKVINFGFLPLKTLRPHNKRVSRHL